MTSTWDERTDNKLRGVGVTKPPPEVPREQTPGTQENPEKRHRIVKGRYGPVVVELEPGSDTELVGGEDG